MIRNNNFLLRIAQADAYAIAVEYVKPEEHVELVEDMLKFEKFHKHPSYDKLSPGEYTDDCQMSLANVELLVKNAHRLSSLSSDEFRDEYFSVFKRDPRDGYSRGFQRLLDECESKEEFAARLVPNSTKNGAAMRAVPFGALKDLSLGLQLAKTQAEATHRSNLGVASAEAVTIMSHYAFHGEGTFQEMKGWCEKQHPIFKMMKKDWVGRVKETSSCPTSMLGSVSLNTVWAVYTLLQRETSLMSMLKSAIEWGGDTDSVCAIAWGIASTRLQNEEIPTFLETGLEPNKKFGVSYLKETGENFMNVMKGLNDVVY